MARVLLKSVTKRYGDVVAVDSVNLEMADREFVVLVGPSGCGKTTTLRMVAGLEEISEGDIFIGERRVNDVAPKDRDIAMVFQNYALYPHMSVFDNMAFGLKLRKIARAEIQRRVEEAGRILDIAHLLDRKPKALSGGQRQRVAMGRAIVRDPQVFLFDEPLSNLDAKLRVQMRVEISRLHKRLERTIVYVTHDQVEAMTLADRIVIMDGGVLQQAGTPIDVYEQPVNTFVAEFIGSPSMNFLDGTASESAGVLAFQGADATLPLRADLRPFLPADGAVRVGFRPQHVRLATDPQADGPRLAGQIEFVEHMGAEKFLYAQVGASRVVARAEGSADVAPGETVELAVDTSQIVVFDQAGRNVRCSV